ncbi:MAG: terpene cyclase/mutase family protein [Planctomycetes bacterium]|nr:terpene cyclase/mutase family protein [Planctomycetota bacterium]
MFRLALFTLCLASSLSAADFEFRPVRVAPTNSDKEPCALQFTWDRPDYEVIAFQAFFLYEEWPENMDKRLPDWRRRLTADFFDAESWKAGGGPRIERQRQAADVDRRPTGFIDRRDTWYLFVAVLVADKDLEWRGISNPRWSAVAPHTTRSDLYYLPCYQPWLAPVPLAKGERLKVEWTLPELPGGDLEITRLLFVSLEGRYWGALASSGKGGIDGLLAGLREDVLPRVQVLKLEQRTGGFEPGRFEYCWVLADTKCGLKFVCPFKRAAGKKDLGDEVNEQEYRKLVKLAGEPVKFIGLPKRAEIARKSGNWYRIKAALDWLKDHQCHDGHWSGTEFSSATTRKKAKITYNAEFVDPGRMGSDNGWSGESADMGLTGLSLMAFVAAGIDESDADYGKSIKRGIGYLLKRQRNDGGFIIGNQNCEFYAHATATIAISELYLIGESEILRPCIRAAASFILKARNPELGWRYAVKPKDSDTSLTTWMMLALRSAVLAGANLDAREAYAGASKWFLSATKVVSGKVVTGYDSPGTTNSRFAHAMGFDFNDTLNAMHICGRLAIGHKDWDSKNKWLVAQAKSMNEGDALPTWSQNKIDYYYWHFGSLALYQMGDKFWQTWRKPLMDALTQNQRGFRKGETAETAETLDEYGSWDAVDAWSKAGGRVYATAMNCLTLQTEWRYTR